ETPSFNHLFLSVEEEFGNLESESYEIKEFFQNRNRKSILKQHTPTLQRKAGSFLYQPNQTPSSSAISSHEGAFLCEEDV
ncbi:hypothetical protein, partial [Pseudoalteromonas sp. SYSU M81241]